MPNTQMGLWGIIVVLVVFLVVSVWLWWPRVPQVTYSSLESHNNKLYAAYAGDVDEDGSMEMGIASFDGSSWSEVSALSQSMRDLGSIALGAYNGRLYLAYAGDVDEDGSVEVGVASSDGSSRSQVSVLLEPIPEGGSVSLEAHGGLLYLSYTGDVDEDGSMEMKVASLNLTTWTPFTTIPLPIIGSWPTPE